MSKVYELNLVEIYGARLNSSEKFKKTQGFPFFGPSPERERKGTIFKGRKKSGERSLILALNKVNTIMFFVLFLTTIGIKIEKVMIVRNLFKS